MAKLKPKDTNLLEILKIGIKFSLPKHLVLGVDIERFPKFPGDFRIKILVKKSSWSYFTSVVVDVLVTTALLIASFLSVSSLPLPPSSMSFVSTSARPRWDLAPASRASAADSARLPVTSSVGDRSLL